jgi:hypothetical protein
MDEYDVQFTPNCLNKLEQIAPLEHIDEALAEVYHVMRTNPHAFNFVPPLTHWRAAKTKLYVREGVVVQPMTLYFVVKEDQRIVKIVDVLIRRGFGDLDF